jgi:uncharacterized damage-inducible protein DinB
MSRSIVEAFLPAVFNTISLIEKTIRTCPKKVWDMKSGKWPVWQHLLHVVAAWDYFVPGNPTHLPPPLTSGMAELENAERYVIPKGPVINYMNEVLAKVFRFLDNLTDEELSQINEKISPEDCSVSFARTLSMIASHPLYHLGFVDAALLICGYKESV